jgi:hypothetical protein
VPVGTTVMVLAGSRRRGPVELDWES